MLKYLKVDIYLNGEITKYILMYLLHYLITIVYILIKGDKVKLLNK